MKNLYKLFLVGAIACILFGCSSNEKAIDYLPVKTDKSEGWGFINAKGEVFLADEYENRPSAVIEGVFSVKEGECYSLYKFDKKKPKLILEDLVYVGIPDGGLIPVTKKDSKIEVVNLEGETVFTLEDIDGGQVYICDKQFNYGYLIVGVQKGSEKTIGLVNRKGEVVLKPKYDDLIIISEDLFLVRVENKDDEEKPKDIYLVNSKGEKQKNIKFNAESELAYCDENYIAVKKEDRIRIYNLKGEELLKCKDNVQSIWDINDGKIVYYDGEESMAGVLDIKGERILAPKFDVIHIKDNGYFAKRDGKDEYDVYNKKGEKEESTDWKNITYVEGFGFLAEEESNDDRYGYQYIINEKGEAIHKNDMFDISDRITLCKYIESDYFSSEALADLMTDAINKELNVNGVAIDGLITNCKYEQDELEMEGCSYKFAEGLKYEVILVLLSDRYMRKPVYAQRPVQSYSYGYYTDYEQYVDHYEIDDEARIQTIVLQAECPSEKRDAVYDMICSRLGKSCNRISDNYFTKGGNHIVVTKDDDDEIDIYYSSLDISSLADDEVEPAEEYAY